MTWWKKGVTDTNILRVLTLYDEEQGYFVAHCLETGSVATADNQDTVEEMIVELLESEITHARDNNAFENLFSSRGAAHLWAMWVELTEQGMKTRSVPLNIQVDELYKNVILSRAA